MQPPALPTKALHIHVYMYKGYSKLKKSAGLFGFGKTDLLAQIRKKNLLFSIQENIRLRTMNKCRITSRYLLSGFFCPKIHKISAKYLPRKSGKIVKVLKVKPNIRPD